MKGKITAWLLAALCVMLAACGGPSVQETSIETAGGGASARIETEHREPEASLPAEVAFTVQELCFTRDGKRIYGELWLPEGEGPFPAVIIGHGLDANLTDTEAFENAELMVIEGAEHGFFGEDETRAAEYAVLFIQSQIN